MINCHESSSRVIAFHIKLAMSWVAGFGLSRVSLADRSDAVTHRNAIKVTAKHAATGKQKRLRISLIGGLLATLSHICTALESAPATPADRHSRLAVIHDYRSPDSRLHAIELSRGPGAESRVDIRDKNTILLTRSYASSDRQHGFVLQHAEWTADSRFFVFSLSSSGGHQPWRFPVFVYSRRTNTLAALEKRTGPITEPDFHLIAPDIIEVMRKPLDAAPEQIRLKLGKLFSPKP